jgi:uncharacterized protein YkwD
MGQCRGDGTRLRGQGTLRSVGKLLLVVVVLAVVAVQFGPPALETTAGGVATNGTAEGTTAATPAPDETVDGANETRIERLVHEEINERRSQRGLSRLSYDTELAAIADGHSADMARRDYFAHVGPDGEDFADRYEAAGYRCRVSTGDNRYTTGGENLAQSWWQRPIAADGGRVYYDSERALADGIVDQWMNSTGHRENILTPYWDNEGIGVDITSEGKVYATQNFC